jgi:hypothetical protein
MIAAGRGPPASAVILVRLRQSARLLPLCATVPQQMAASPCEATIGAILAGLADDLVGLEEEGWEKGEAECLAG